MTEPKAILTAGDDDASPAYLFNSRSDPLLHAITRHPSGANLPPLETPDEWVFDGLIALGIREALPVRIAPEPVLRGLLSDGYFVWRDRSNPRGTSQ
jgi:hypothetical protein